MTSKKIIRGALLAVFACVLGCSRSEISSEGKIVHVIRCSTIEGATSEAIQKCEKDLRDIPSKAPIIQRLEWGRLEDKFSETHLVLATFDNPESTYDSDYRQAIQYLGEPERPGPNYIRTSSTAFLFRDATPQVQTSTHRRLRRIIDITESRDTTPEQRRDFQDALAALPEKIPAIERLEWGTKINYDPRKPGPLDPVPFNGQYCLIFTFSSTRARDECLAHPAYKDFQNRLEQYASKQNAIGAQEYVAHVEYVTQTD